MSTYDKMIAVQELRRQLETSEAIIARLRSELEAARTLYVETEEKLSRERSELEAAKEKVVEQANYSLRLINQAAHDRMEQAEQWGAAIAERDQARSRLEAARAKNLINFDNAAGENARADHFEAEAKSLRSQLSDTERRLGEAVELLRLHSKNHNFREDCAWDDGLPCYTCLTVSFLRDLDRPLPSPPGGAHCDCSVDGYNDGSCSIHPIVRRRPSPTPSGVAGADQPTPGEACANWCGTSTTVNPPIDPACPYREHFTDGGRDWWCSIACGDARRPLHPAPPHPAAEPLCPWHEKRMKCRCVDRDHDFERDHRIPGKDRP
jgi:hypothetical protein